mgnify:FL=1
MLISDADRQSLIADAINAKQQGIKLTQEDLGLAYGISPTSVRRVLAEAKLVEFKTHKCDWEDDLIKCLKSHGLDDLQTLSSFIHKAKQNEHAIQSAQA